MPNRNVSELAAITAAKNLCKYVFLVTNKSPKIFRFSLVSRMQNFSLNIIEKLYRANEVFIKINPSVALQARLNFQHTALTDIKLLSYMAFLAKEQGCILPKQYEHIAKLSFDCQNLLGAWIKHTNYSLQSGLGRTYD